MAYKAISTSGNLIGVILNGIKCKFDKHEDNTEDDTKFKHIETFLNKVDKEANVFCQYPNVCRVLNIDIISVDDMYRGKGVCKALIDKTK